MTAGASTAPPAAAVPFTVLDAGDPELMAELMTTVERVALDSAFTLGAEVERFEREFAAYCGTGTAVGVSSGTSALALTLTALGLGPGDEAIVPANSFVATAEAVSATGATPRLVDVDEETELLTAELCEPAIRPRTRCVIPVHLRGRTVELDPLLALCRERGVAVVSDACQAHGARYRDRPVGSYGDAACFSFYPTKNLGAWGDGGAVVTDDEWLAERVRSLRSHGEGRRRNRHETVAGTDRLHALQAAILSVKLRRLDDCTARRRSAAAELRAALAESAVGLPAAPDTHGDHVFHLFSVRSRARDALRDHLAGERVATAVHYPTPIHLQPAYRALGLGPGSLPASERLARESLSLPLFPTISAAQIERVATAVSSFGR